MLEKYKDGYFKSVEEHYSDKLVLIKVKYALEVLRNELIKFVIMGIIFYCVGSISEYLFAFFFLIPNRIFSGGLHMKNGIRCFFFSLSFFSVIIFLTPHIAMRSNVLLLLTVVCWLIIIAVSPIASSEKPIITVTKYYYCKVLSGIITALSIVFLAAALARGYRDIFYYGCWVIDLQCCQLIIAYLMLKLGKENNDIKT